MKHSSQSTLVPPDLANESSPPTAVEPMVGIPEVAQATATIADLATEPTISSKSGDRQAAWQVFGSTFITIFLAELGDKTQLTTLLMAAETHNPWVVFIGAGSALVATSLIGVWLGCWLAKRVPAHTLERAAGVLLLLIATQLVWESFHP
ncbi:MAG: TMEM165/GDT1 family protein [Elainella sp. Prado103]|nr:TMEM165/GDT1 family protein [Elainella sp. Prado103]